jgi:imidazolonepropionase-like amidohydrolase
MPATSNRPRATSPANFGLAADMGDLLCSVATKKLAMKSPAAVSICLFAIFLFSSGQTPARGQTPSPTPSPSPVVIKAGKLLDVRSGKISSNVFILVENHRIKSVNQEAPTGVPVIDLSYAFVMPGMIDCHAHILGNLRDYTPGMSFRTSSPKKTLWGVRNLRLWLDNGFTTLRDAGEEDPAYGQLALRDAINEGLVEGPRIQSAGSFVSVTGGHGDADFFSADQELARRPNLADTVEQIEVAVRRDIKYGADWIKLMGTGGVMDLTSDFHVQELSEEQMAKAVEVAHRAGKRVMVHAEGTAGIKAAARAGVDTIEHGTMMDDEGAALMAKKGIWLVPTLETFQRGATSVNEGMDPINLAKGKEILSYQQPAFTRARKAHLKIALGLDDAPEFLPKELEALVNGGMTPLEALQAATVSGAELLEWSDRIGSIEPGKFADIIAMKDDPTQDIKAVEKIGFVMKDGMVFKNSFAHKD